VRHRGNETLPAGLHHSGTPEGTGAQASGGTMGVSPMQRVRARM
jgi:hypothetical protein